MRSRNGGALAEGLRPLHALALLGFLVVGGCALPAHREPAVEIAPGLRAQLERYALPAVYESSERAYLAAYPELGILMRRMVEITQRQLPDPAQDILHNRVCAALAYRMARDSGLARREQRLAIAADLLHNIAKEEKAMLLTDAGVRGRVGAMVARLRAAGYLRNAPTFWSDERFVSQPAIGDNLALIHHATGAVMAGEILESVGGYASADIALMQDAIVSHSTGYWYFRQSVDDAAKARDQWNRLYPEPESPVARIAHDADLVSQFEFESVVPEGSKWRLLAARRWGARGPAEEAHVVYYVFSRLFDEARTDAGRKLAQEQWDRIRPELVKRMALAPGTDPILALGTPRAFQR